MSAVLAAQDAILQAIEARAPFYPDTRHPSYQHLLDSIEAFQQAIEQSGAVEQVELSEAAIRHANAIQDRPVFIGGLAKSGTTLLRNLLDGHPQLAAFPVEGGLFHRLLRRPGIPFAERVTPWLRDAFSLLVSTDQGGGPHWLLSSGQPSIEPYARYIAAFRRRLSALPPEDESLIRASLFAFLVARDISPEQASREIYWVEKTPSNVQNMDRILGVYPSAKFLFILRDPRASVASTRARHLKKYGNFDLQHLIEKAREVYRIVQEAAARLPEETVLLTRYEDLVRDAPGEMARIAAFLGIDFDEVLLEPTVGGLPARPNTGHGQNVGRTEVFTGSLDKWRTTLSRAEIDLTSSYLHPYTAAFGYEPLSTSALVYARAALRIRQEYAGDGLSFSLRRAVKAWLRR